MELINKYWFSSQIPTISHKISEVDWEYLFIIIPAHVQILNGARSLADTAQLKKCSIANNLFFILFIQNVQENYTTLQELDFLKEEPCLMAV